jgi:hypothetical protein
LEPTHLRFGGGVDDSIVNPLIFAIVIAAGLLIVFSPRHKALVAFVVVSLLIPTDQVLVLGGLHFPMLRLLALFGMARMVKAKLSSKQAIFSGGLNNLDRVIILLTMFVAIDAVLLFQEAGAAVYQIGNLYTVFGVYFLLRFLIRDLRDVERLVRTLTYVVAVVAIIMAIEQATGHNPYAALGGARSSSYADLMERDGRFRATGCFEHPLLAGAFGATQIPLFVLLWSRGRKQRLHAAIGLISCTIIVVASNSSTPILAYAAGIMALLLWPLRAWMRTIRWGIVGVLAGLHVVMKAPVWHLIARVDISGGSSSYHRFMLVDQCIRHFNDWWLLGVKSTYEWGWDMWDTCNQYVATAEYSGLLPFLLFIGIFVYGFKYLGGARKATRDRREQYLAWALGAALFANLVAFWGISYVDQIVVLWYGVLASISAVWMVRLRPPSIDANLETDRQQVAATKTSHEQPEPIDQPIEVYSPLRTSERSIIL